MKNPINKLALYVATILVSALPFTMEYADAIDKLKNQQSTVVNNETLTAEEQKKAKHKA
ncbi:hypothetical protein MGMO_163c00040 [Methyloglobulus morosus KoM1]|uniref:Uncharacterized protein n=1 Tax=Methyloglobulus morosus KoM1 TaxID=1116472 RepID=V5BIK1_9GAMM|nr:hypothetical protein [Methyloglobulus morosus]ESS67569.1 hypothetical protein MGMO_163c00040 [Methyloglobulus morosus KoM1]